MSLFKVVPQVSGYSDDFEKLMFAPESPVTGACVHSNPRQAGPCHVPPVISPD
jgi:hypothetical protein